MGFILDGNSEIGALLKKSAYDPYLKFLDFSKVLGADTPMKFRLHPSHSNFGTPSTQIILVFYAFFKEIF